MSRGHEGEGHIGAPCIAGGEVCDIQDIASCAWVQKESFQVGMIEERTEHSCTKCQSTDLVRNGRDYKGAQKYRCNACGAYGTVAPKGWYSEEEKDWRRIPPVYRRCRSFSDF